MLLCKEFRMPVVKSISDQTRALTTIRNAKITFNVPSHVATTTSLTAAFDPGNKQRPRRIGY